MSSLWDLLTFCPVGCVSVWPGASQMAFSPAAPVPILFSLPSYLLPSLPFSCPCCQASWLRGKRSWLAMPSWKSIGVSSSCSSLLAGNGQLAKGQRQPPIAVAFSPLGVNLTLRGNTWEQGMGWSRAVSFPFTPKRPRGSCLLAGEGQSWAEQVFVHFRNVGFLSFYASPLEDWLLEI